MNYIIITGASKGLGKAIAYNLLSDKNTIFCISRRQNIEIMESAKDKNCVLEYFEYDLDNVYGIDELCDHIFAKINLSIARSIILVNNAGIVAPIKPIGKCTAKEIINSLNVNTIAPMVLSSAFIRNTEGFPFDKRIINISSGAGKEPYYGWGCYCSSKAAIDLFTQCVGVEQEEKENPVKIISFAPGIMDTMMQQEIRMSSADDFKQIDRFIGFKTEGKLLPPDFVANKVINMMFNDEFKQGGIVDIYE